MLSAIDYGWWELIEALGSAWDHLCVHVWRQVQCIHMRRIGQFLRQYLRTSGSRCPFSLRGKGQTQILAEFGTLWLIDRLFGCYERPRKPVHICGGDTRGNTRMTWQSCCEMSFNTCLGRQAQQWNVWWFNVMLAFWLIVLSVHHGYLRSIWRLSWISLWRSKKYLFLCFSLHHSRSSYNNHKRWKILRM